MANLSEQSIWEIGVYQIEENDPVHGGANGITNRPTKQLANRTVWLKNELASSVQAINANLASLSTNKADKTLNLVAGNGLTGGGTLQANRTLTLGTPSKITASTTNAVQATSHTHEIDKASTTVAGIVQLVDNLTTDDATKALTAKQGKVLNDKITATDTKANNKVDKSGDTMTGVLGITRNAWEKMRFTNADGSFWRFESAPIASGENGARFNWVFTGGAGTEVGRIIFPRVTGSETIAYQRWVQTANVASATKLQTARTINGVAFDGTANITITDNTKAPAVHRHNWSEIDSIPAVITNPARITEGNLDSYMAEGFYYCNNNIQATSIANTPVNRAFALQVLKTAGVVQVCYEYQTTNVFVRARSGSGSWSAWRRLSTTEDNAPTATQLQTPRNIAMTGDGSWNVNFDGSANASGAFTLANSGVTAGSYNSVTVDAKGRVTRGLSQVHGLITATTATGTANQATTNTNTYLNIVASGVGQTASVGSSTQITGTNGITISSDTAGKLIVTRDSNSPTATKLATARTLSITGDGTGQANFDGSANANIALTLANSGVTAGSYNSVTVDAKGRVTAGLTQTHGLVTATTATGTANQATTNTNTYLNIVASGVGQTASVGSSTQITGTNGITVSSDTAGKLIVGQTLANSLTDTSTAKALTANMGKALKDELDTTVKLTGDQTITGRKTFGEITVSPASIDNSLIMGVGSGDIFIKNTVANKYLQFKNDGTLAISNDKVWLYSDRSDAVNLDRTDKVATAKAVKSLNDTKLGKTENAVSATKLQAARTISLTGAVTGSVSFDGSKNVGIATTLSKAVVREYNSSFISSIGVTNYTIPISGQVVTGADGRITQYIHLQHFRDIWFAMNENSVGNYSGEGTRSRLLQIPLWTAMPNKVLSVSAQAMRSTNTAQSAAFFGEAGEHQVAWAKRQQGINKTHAFVEMARIIGGASEEIDMFVIVEGY